MHNDPIFVVRIEDRQGNLISSFIPQSQDAINERTAYTMITMLEGVVSGGTGGRLRQYVPADAEVGGKTGTSNENRDGWFMCVTPRLVAGAWVGGEDQSVHLLSRGEGGVVALPIVGDFLKRVYAHGGLGISSGDRFVRPAQVERFDCEEEVDPAALRPGGISADDDFFFD